MVDLLHRLYGVDAPADMLRICSGADMLRGAGCLHMVQLMPLHPKTPSSLASFKSRLVLPFW